MDHAARAGQWNRNQWGVLTLAVCMIAGSWALPGTASADGPTCAAAGAWRRFDTANFAVCCPSSMDPAVIGRQCEALRDELAGKWFGGSARITNWNERCYVVFHPSEASYLREVGEGGRSTLGSSLVTTHAANKIVARRIDLRGDVTEPLQAALPHELTHVLMADAFAGGQLPRWADEGMAMQADPPEKLARHSRDLNEAMQRRSEFHVGELLAETNYPGGAQRAVFYGESASVVGFLIARRPPAEFVSFVRRAGSEGYDAALRDVYGIQDVGQLEHLWKSRAEVALR
jgi:hypothetical protein